MNFTRLAPIRYKGVSIPEKLAYLERLISKCQKCPDLAARRRNTVPGYGPTESGGIVLVGEAPGADEDANGVPFVGQSGQFLTKALREIGLLRQDVYFLNCLKCRPIPPLTGGNSAPSKVEMEECIPYLYAQIEILDPAVIVTLGSHAASALGFDEPMASIRGKALVYRDWDVVPTWHPSFVLRSSELEVQRQFSADLLKAARLAVS